MLDQNPNVRSDLNLPNTKLMLDTGLDIRQYKEQKNA